MQIPENVLICLPRNLSLMAEEMASTGVVKFVSCKLIAHSEAHRTLASISPTPVVLTATAQSESVLALDAQQPEPNCGD
jgi:hypothetical protein